MSLSSALATAMSGLRANQAAFHNIVEYREQQTPAMSPNASSGRDGERATSARASKRHGVSRQLDQSFRLNCDRKRPAALCRPMAKS